MRTHSAAPAVLTVLVAGVLVGCSGAEPQVEAQAESEVPSGFSADDLFPPDVWVSEPEPQSPDCSENSKAMSRCWSFDILIESECDGYAIVSVEEFDKSGRELASYQQMVGITASPGTSQNWSWSADARIAENIDHIDVTEAVCAGEM